MRWPEAILSSSSGGSVAQSPGPKVGHAPQEQVASPHSA
jgi:hypothetical protein